jgi:hypothetical protein
MRKIVLLICILGIPCASWAQERGASWANLNALRAGQAIQIVELNEKKDSGTFVNVSDTAITYRDEAGEQIIQKQDVRSVKRLSRRARHTLIGAAVGFGAGAGVGAGTPQLWNWSNHPTFGDRVGSIVGIGVTGSVMGAIVGVLLPTRRTVYHVNSR